VFRVRGPRTHNSLPALPFVSIAKNYRHPGNQHLLQLARDNASSFHLTSLPGWKAVATSIVNEIHHRGGRFRRFDAIDGVWREVDDDAAHYKVMQALRETKPAMDFVKDDVLKAVIKLGGGTHLVDAVKQPLQVRSHETSASAATQGTTCAVPEASLLDNYKKKLQYEREVLKQRNDSLQQRMELRALESRWPPVTACETSLLDFKARVGLKLLETMSDTCGPPPAPASSGAAKLLMELASLQREVGGWQQHASVMPSPFETKSDSSGPPLIAAPNGAAKLRLGLASLQRDAGGGQQHASGMPPPCETKSDTCGPPPVAAPNVPITHLLNHPDVGFSPEEMRFLLGMGAGDDKDDDVLAERSAPLLSGDTAAAGQPSSTRHESAVSVRSADPELMLCDSRTHGAREGQSVLTSTGARYETTRPADHDVLLGRGRFPKDHAGNKWYDAIIEEKSVLYHASSVRNKGRIVEEIVRFVRNSSPPGHFLEYDAKAKVWRDGGDRKARTRVRMSLWKTSGEPDGPPLVIAPTAE
jgi:hypothetical protein